MGGEFSDDDGEAILSGLDEDVELKEDREGEEGDGERRVFAEEAEVEGEVVEEAIGVGGAVVERERAAVERRGLDDG